jgi:hypothetical protein
MRTVMAAIGLAAVVLMTGTAHATLVVTDGVVIAQNADTFAGFSGDRFGVTYSEGVPSANPFTGSASAAFAGGFVVVQVDGVGCGPVSSHSCGFVSLIAHFTDLPPAPSSTAPFTATGHLFVDNVAAGLGVLDYDFVGQGTVERCGPPDSPRCIGFEGLAFTYTFSPPPPLVPEPPTLLLVAFGLFGALFIARFFATAGHRTAVRLLGGGA